MNRLLRVLPVAVPAVAIALICFLSGPDRFDAVDGAEFAVAGRNMDIAHPPGYPLLLFLVRSTGAVTGYSYTGLRLLSCLLAALAYPLLRKAFESLGASRAGSLAGSFLFLCLPPVLSQTCILEVHSLAILLAAWAVSARNSPAGPYLFSLAVFGGHPTSAVLLPLAVPRRIRHDDSERVGSSAMDQPAFEGPRYRRTVTIQHGPQQAALAGHGLAHGDAEAPDEVVDGADDGFEDLHGGSFPGSVGGRDWRAAGA